MKNYQFEAEAAVEFDVEAAFEWYETEEQGLGFEFLQQLRAAYQRILDHPFGYQELRSAFGAHLSANFPTPCISRLRARLSS